jgi:molecular chaperone GrpE
MAKRLKDWVKKIKNMNTTGENNNEKVNNEQEVIGNEENTSETQENIENEGDSQDKKEESLEEKIKVQEDKYLRLFSEFDNFRKRTQKEKAELISATKADVFKLILPILDDFDRALKSITNASDVESLKEGVELIHSKILQTLKSKGLESMDILHQEFNADEHEAITNIPAPNEDLKGKIVDVVETGYKLNDKIIRYPKVVVGN